MRSLMLLMAVDVLAQPPARFGVGMVERKLALAETIETALKNNLEIEIERTNVALAGQAVHAARGAFDGLFRYSPSGQVRNTPTSSSLISASGKLEENFMLHNLSYLQKLAWGASLNGFFENNRSSTNNPFTGLTPFLVSRLGATFTQPLWRNRQTDRDRAEIRIRSKNLNVSQSDLELRVIDVVVRAELAYWDLVAARQNVRVAEEAVGVAREQVARAQRMIDQGTLAPIELSAADAELQRRLDTYYSSLGIVTQAENQIKSLITASRSDEIWNDALIPVDETAPAMVAGDVREAVNEAIRKRPEFRSLDLRRETNDIQQELARDQMKPQLNFAAGYYSTGLAGVRAASGDNAFTQSNALIYQRLNQLSAQSGLAPVTPPSFGSAPGMLVGSYGTTLSNLFGGSYQTIQLGLSLDWNVRNRAAEASLAQTVIGERRLKLERTRLEQAVEVQVRNAMQEIETARQRITAAQASAKAAKEKLDSETRLFQVGESTNFFVLTRQNEYTDSLRRVVLAKLDLNRALVRLHLATGETLKAHKISAPGAPGTFIP